MDAGPRTKDSESPLGPRKVGKRLLKGGMILEWLVQHLSEHTRQNVYPSYRET